MCIAVPGRVAVLSNTSVPSCRTSAENAEDIAVAEMVDGILKQKSE
jgi:hydrogenase maturation factor